MIAEIGIATKENILEGKEACPTMNKETKTVLKDLCIIYLEQVLLASKPYNYIRQVDEILLKTLIEYNKEKPETEIGLLLTSEEYRRRVKEKMPELQEELFDNQISLYLCLLLHFMEKTIEKKDKEKK